MGNEREEGRTGEGRRGNERKNGEEREGERERDKNKWNMTQSALLALLDDDVAPGFMMH